MIEPGHDQKPGEHREDDRHSRPTMPEGGRRRDKAQDRAAVHAESRRKAQASLHRLAQVVVASGAEAPINVFAAA
jgi:hypothetical protein